MFPLPANVAAVIDWIEGPTDGEHHPPSAVQARPLQAALHLPEVGQG